MLVWNPKIYEKKQSKYKANFIRGGETMYGDHLHRYSTQGGFFKLIILIFNSLNFYVVKKAYICSVKLYHSRLCAYCSFFVLALSIYPFYQNNIKNNIYSIVTSEIITKNECSKLVRAEIRGSAAWPDSAKFGWKAALLGKRKGLISPNKTENK